MNRLKTTLLLALMSGLVLAIGYMFGGQMGLTIALGISVIMNVSSYWFSDKMVLKMYKAQEVTSGSHPKLLQMVRELASVAKLPMPKVYIVDMPVPNAFATGRNPKHSAVAVSPAIMELLTDAELKGVLAHELSHIQNRDILISTIAATLAAALSYIANMAYYAGIFGFGGNDREGGSNIASTIAMVILTPLIAGILQMSISRSREFLADDTGARMTRDPNSLANALAKLGSFSQTHKLIGKPSHQATAHMFIVNPFKKMSVMSLFSTHPPMEERIAKLRALRIGIS